jgi:hypothetical protein
MDYQQSAIDRGAEGFFPARADVQRIQIKNDCAKGKENAAGQRKRFRFGSQFDKRSEVEADQVHADEKAREEAEAAEDDFLENDSGSEKDLCADEPKDGDVVAGIVRRHSCE